MNELPSRVCGCHDVELVQSMITYIAQTESYFGDIQRGTESPTRYEKEVIAHEILHKSPATFLTRYGKQLNQLHKKYFYDNFSDQDDLIYQLKIIENDLLHHDVQIKNRRFTAMKRMMIDGEYFSDEQMKQRDPLLYDQMIGQYLTDDEIKHQSDSLFKNHCGLSSILLEQMDSKENSNLYDRQLDKQMDQMEESDDDDEEEDSGGDEENDNRDEESSDKDTSKKISEDERLALREEFLHTMQERFLSGEDKDFNYEAVDEMADYDDLVQESRDAEEKYFDDDDDDDDDDSENEDTVEQSSMLSPDDYDY